MQQDQNGQYEMGPLGGFHELGPLGGFHEQTHDWTVPKVCNFFWDKTN